MRKNLMLSKSLYQTFFIQQYFAFNTFLDKKIINRKKSIFQLLERFNFWKILSVLDLIVQIGRKMDVVH